MIGFAIFTYPFDQNAFSQYLDQQVIRQFQKESTAKNDAELAAIQAKMIAENEEKQVEADILAKELAAAEALLANDTSGSATDTSQDFFVKHTLGILTIPAINGEMPVYDRGTEIFLKKGAALLNGSSLPVGGKSTHAVIMAHRGMPEAELFSKLPQVKEGDLFFIDINGETLAYEVDQINIIEPTDIDDLLIVPDEDYVTLMTCTPYMVNSHRYLVRGMRTDYVDAHAQMKSDVRWKTWLRIIGTVAAILAAAGVVVYLINRQKKEPSKTKKQKNSYVGSTSPIIK
ncbi:hypothetical protein A5886_001477 [Enterococcus sp. 8G7_MSG3316]|uniref:Sortase n=1 Tax=Candidatus Enterococcus testudinis TaxID=1834191 RepID=A0A242A678_9ENTE|nr:class C sortase [Enterococcus sp. 8G7_MSG3316]OTN76400.1 hypothetical protein A5886_001477 [Enterococcus sp. 8G7_MSG3316]